MTPLPPGAAEAAADVAGPARVPLTPAPVTNGDGSLTAMLVHDGSLAKAISDGVDARLRGLAQHLEAGGARLNLAADIYAFLTTAPPRQDAQAPTPPPLPGASPESLEAGWFPSRCVICWKAITQYDTYGVSHPPGRRWHWDCVRAEAAHVGYAHWDFLLDAAWRCINGKFQARHRRELEECARRLLPNQRDQRGSRADRGRDG